MPNETYKEKYKTQIDRLLKARKSDALLIYITGDKRPTENFGTQVHPEVIPLFYDHLKSIGKKKKISLLLYTAGGALETPWALVNLVREYCSTFEVLVPFKALSAGTLLCLGADKIVTTSLSNLSPIDPTGNFIVNNQQRSIQVEDVTGFIDFAKKRVGLKTQESLVEILKSLTSDTPPQILGNIHRTYTLIRLLVDKMFSLHKKTISEPQKKLIKESLTEKLYSHQHLINRKELLKIGFKGLVDELGSEEGDLLELFDFFSNKMELVKEFDPEARLNGQESTNFQLTRAIISSKLLTHQFVSDCTVQKQEISPGKTTIFLNVKNKGWIEREI